MPSDDQERQRLAAHYESMTDGELEQVASDAASLTDVARQALTYEIERRHANIAVNATPAPVTEAQYRELITVAQFRDLPSALLAKGSLESAGIEAFLADDNMIRMDWFISNLLGGIKLKVRTEDAELAAEILSSPVPQMFEVEGVGDYEQPTCPRCGSVEVTQEAGRDQRALAALWVASVPLPLSSDLWKCEACGNEWQARASPTT
jgi:hypothetical protein